MKEFIKRNSSVLVVGGFLLVVFSIIIVVNRMKPTINQPGLVKLTQQENKVIEEQTQQINETKETTTTEDYKEVDINLGNIEVSYTNKGFEPKTKNIEQGQKVVWTNKTTKVMTLEPLSKTFADFISPIEIKPNEKIEFRFTKIGMWAYQEKETKNYGRFMVTLPN